MVFNFVLSQLLAIACIFTAIVMLYIDDSGSNDQKLMSYFLCGALVQNVGYLLELVSPTPEAALVAIKVQYVGSTFVPLCYCYFVYSYSHMKTPGKLIAAIGCIDMAVLALVFTSNRHTLYYSGWEWNTAPDGHHYLSLSYGPAYPVFLLVSCILPFAMTLVTLIRAVIKFPRQASNRKYWLAIIFSCLPAIALLAYAMKLTHMFDPTPATLGIVMSMIVILVWRRRTYDYQRLAAEVLVEGMSDGVIAVDMEMRALQFNQAAVRIFPALKNRVKGDFLDDMPELRTYIDANDDNACYFINDRYYESHVHPILSKNGYMQGYIFLILDVTDTKNYIEEIKRVRKQAEQANQAKSEFLANMSHEIRTPMNAIMGLSDLIMEESAGRKLYNFAADIKSSAQNLLSIINDILDLSKVESGKMELVQAEYYVKPVVKAIVSMMDIAASQRGLAMKCEIDESLPGGYFGDEGRIRQILINLINNAIKFTKQGHVKLSVTGRPGGREDEELLVFSVEDTGCGIRQEDQEKIFENFKQVDMHRNRSVEGTGLGLSITKHLVQLMGGSINLDSIYGAGSVFTVTIPQRITDRRSIADTADMARAQEKRRESFVTKGVSALVVDDNLINRKVAKGFLSPYHMELDEAASGFEAIELVKQKKYDIIFMDHMMPEMDGIQATKIIREECGENGRAPAVVALTANAMEGVREKFIELGFEDYLSKPMDRDALNEVLIRLIPEEKRDHTQEESPWAARAGGRADNPEEADDAGESGARKIDIPGIDADVAMKNSGGSFEDYKEILQLYCLDGKRKQILLHDLFETRDYANYEVEVHALKSASANIGAMKLSGMAKEHEDAAGRQDEEFISAHFEELMAAYVNILCSLKAFLNVQSGMAADGQEAEEIDRESLIERVRNALDNLEHFHSRECADEIDSLLQCRLEEKVMEKLSDVREQLRLYEDENAEDMLHAILEQFERKEI